MASRILIAVLLSMLVLSPVHAHKAPGWEQDPVLHGLETAHADRKRLHERWLPQLQLELQVNWERQRERMAVLLCDLGVIALALFECSWASAGASIPMQSLPTADHPAADVEAFRQRPLEARMRSI